MSYNNVPLLPKESKLAKNKGRRLVHDPMTGISKPVVISNRVGVVPRLAKRFDDERARAVHLLDGKDKNEVGHPAPTVITRDTFDDRVYLASKGFTVKPTKSDLYYKTQYAMEFAKRQASEKRRTGVSEFLGKLRRLSDNQK